MTICCILSTVIIVVLVWIGLSYLTFSFYFPVLACKCLYFSFVFLLFLSSDDVFHNLGKEDHRHPTPVAPRNSPTSLAPLPPFSGTSHPSSPSTHLPSIGTQSFSKTVTQTPTFMDVHPGLCLSASDQPTALGEGLVSGPNSVCRSVHHPSPSV